MKTMAQIVVKMAFKADADPASRTFEGLASTWEQDLGNDVIKQGAFKDTIKEWRKGGDAIPLLNSHDHWNVLSTLGQMVDAKETSEGLWTKWEVLDGPEGDAVLARLRPSKTTGRPIIGKMSIGYEPQEFSFEQPKGTESFFDRLRILSKVALKEVSLVLFPMNPGAAIDPSTVKMFMDMTRHTDPTKLSVQMKTELRKLNSRIGLLLKKQKPSAKVEADPEDEDIEIPEEALDDEEDEILDDQDDSDESEETEETEEVEVVEEVTEEIETPPEGEAKTYTYQEALQHRLQKTLFKNKVSTLNEK